MILKNAKITDESFEIIEADILTEGERILKIAPKGTLNEDGQEVLDLTGKLILPGFIDIHIHGSFDTDTGDATYEALENMSSYLVKNGVTSFCPTSMTLWEADLHKVLGNAKNAMDKGVSGAYIQGVNMEGPYISISKIGAQNPAFQHKPDPAEFKRLYEACGGIVKLVDIAPEEEGGDEFIKEVAPLCTISIAHTAATYEQAKHGFDLGISHATHLFNAMSGLSHREPGVVGAVFDSDVTAEIICDGHHINPAVLRIAFSQLGEDRPVIISDACSGAGLPDCDRELGGQPIYIRGGLARLANGTIAASASNMLQEFKNLISYGVPFKSAAKAASINPARVIREDANTGSIKEGKLADLLVLNEEDLELAAVIVKGELKVKN
ncbi:MAG: N-acetylglucosamine-6-phosphate deacetylase [Oscillospiraceae bacterium]|jgi:N-acetylglucosamine-6-phosphate deacetylase|nr:N-acetylglucosamine-6-phosphate deacetylase [Oscillospiraceae bacterium]